MIVYFADRQLNILGQASTKLPKGLKIVDDLKTEDIETGVAVFECTISFDDDTREQMEACTEGGNYILRSYGNENEFYTIIDTEIDTKKQEITVYAEDAGLDLLNEIVGPYEATEANTLAFYVTKFAYDSGFKIGINQATGLKRKLSWDGESTVTERIASIATQFDGCEVSYSFEVKGLQITDKFINIYKQRGKDIGAQLRLNKEIDNIITKKSVANLATGLYVTGGTPEDSEVPISLDGYKYDDGDFFVQGPRLYSRKAGKKWSRYNWKNEPNQLEGASGYIVRPFNYDTTDQKTLFSHALAELKKVCDMEVNYEVDISKLPDNARIGDRVDIIDDAGELYMSSRILLLEASAVDDVRKATLGEHLMKTSGISQKVADLAAQLAKTSKSAARALAIANNATTIANAAQQQAGSALADAQAAQQAAQAAQNAANNALESASDAQEKATAAQGAVEKVEESVSSLETTVSNAQKAADNAQQAANTAQQKADEAAQAAAEAKADAADAKAQTEVAQGKAETAITKAEEAIDTAGTAKTDAATAKETADAAKLDAEKANQDIAALGEQLETVSTTMQADYARKTDLTETEASLQSQISQNAAQISSTVSKLATVDETANNAKEQAEAAQAEAEAARAKADQATTDAEAAQTAADNAAAAATAAQNEADKAKAAAATAQGVADKAEADLKAAQADLATVSSRVDATEDEIEAAQQAVTAAQTAADKAKDDAAAAAKKATDAQSTADTAVSNAANAQTAANNAASAAAAAQKTADEAKGDAAAAQTKANEAATAAAEAQRTADTARTNAANAQAKADQAATDAATAQQAAADADAKAAQAAADLATAQQNLANVTSRVDATEEEVAAAQAAVETAQAAADKAKADAATAQSTADTAKANAATAQTAANNAKTAADNAQAAADDAQKAADDAQAAVDALAVRVTSAETSITQNSEEIALRAKKTEVVAAPKFSGQHSSVVSIENVLTDGISNLRIFGKTIQNGTPTPETPVPLESVGADGNVAVTVCGKNLLKYPYYRQLRNGDTYTTYGNVTYTVNADGSITFTGTNSNTAPASGGFVLTYNEISYKSAMLWLPIGTYTFSTGVEYSSAHNWFVYIAMYTGSIEGGDKAVNGGTVTFKVTEPGLIYIAFRVKKGTTVDNVTVYPQLEVGSVAGSYEKPVAQTLTAQTPNGLPGIPVSSGGNYTDENGQMWICDEIDFARGKYVKRVNRQDMTNYNSLNFGVTSAGIHYVDVRKNNDGITKDVFLCNCYLPDNISLKDKNVRQYSNSFTVYDNDFTDVETAKAKLESLGFMCLYRLATPIETDLTAEEIAAFKALHSNKPNTTIYNDSGAGMVVELSGFASEASIKHLEESLGGYSTKTETAAQIKVESDSIRQTVSETYAEKETVETEIAQLADRVDIVFRTTGDLDSVDKEFNDKFNEFYSYISLAGGSITLGHSQNPITLRIAPEGIEFLKNGEVFGSWDGDYFFTGNIHVRLNERLQLGNFIALPRSDGSLMWLKAGG